MSHLRPTLSRQNQYPPICTPKIQPSPLAHLLSPNLAHATLFDYGAGSINPSKAIDPGLVFYANFKHYIQFLCAVPGVDDDSVMRAVGVGCPTVKKTWCSDLSTASVTISNLVGSRKVIRRVTNVGKEAGDLLSVCEGAGGVTITIQPQVFKISVDSSRHLTLVLEATEATNDYTFGEMVLQGNRRHVRVPKTVFVTSSL